MKPTVFRKNTCRLCAGKGLEPALHLAPTPSGDAYISQDKLKIKQELYPLDLALCRDCGHAQLFDVVDPELLYNNYIYTTSISLGLVKHFQEYADEVIKYVGPPNGALVVDIGSNDGTLLKALKSGGMKVLGIDPAPVASRKAIESGIETLQTFFTVDLARKIKEERGSVFIITANNVFANIDDLGQLMEGMRLLLAPEGVFVFETGYLLDLVENKLIDNIYHEHISYYAITPLDKFFRSYGMEIIDVKRSVEKGGSFRAMVKFIPDKRKVSSSVRELISLEKAKGITDAQAFNSLTGKIENTGIELSNLLDNLKSQGKTIAGYGASVGVTTLIYLFKLADSLDFLLDDNSSRHGLFSPGYHLPVLPSQVLYERKPDYVLILAWRYAEAIIKKHKKFLEQGGHFILPLPEIKVI